jgi:L-ascorbate metabolism protein UlaG (beta-lactamase superfamily)
MPSFADVTWLGHATVLVEAGGARVLTDPVLRQRVAHLRRRTPEPQAPERLDAVLLSHLHRDHADAPSLRRVAAGVPVLVPRGAGRTVERMGVDDVREVAPGDRVEVAPGVVVEAVRADHDGRRSPFSREAAGTLGYVVDAGPRVYFAGDTELYDTMTDLDAPDLALLPVWGWGPTLGTGHMDPREAARAAALVHPAIAVPIHWGTFLPLHLRGHHPVLSTPGGAFAGHVADLAPDVRVEILKPGAGIRVNGR